MRFERVEHLLHIGLKQIDLRGRGVSVEQSIRLSEGNRRECVGLNVGEQIDRILDMRRPLRRVSHDRSRILEGIANLAVGNAQRMGRIRERRLTQRRR